MEGAKAEVLAEVPAHCSRLQHRQMHPCWSTPPRFPAAMTASAPVQSERKLERLFRHLTRGVSVWMKWGRILPSHCLSLRGSLS